MGMQKRALVFVLLALGLSSLRSLAADALPEPGPESAGLRMRLLVTLSGPGAPEGYGVQVDLINTTPDAITFRAHRPSSRIEGGVEARLEAAVSIESYPAIQPWLGQVMADREGSTPEPEYTLPAGETLSLKWQTVGRHLKNRVTNPLEVQNPEFTEDGLHSMHATLVVRAGGHPVLLRSNEQLVRVGGSAQLPKHTYAPIWWTDEKTRTAELSLGSQHKVAPGDRFIVHTGTIGMTWTLTITKVEDDRSLGSLAPSQETPLPRFPSPGAFAGLIRKD
jgi:hypothetical protein